jgi:hypothetical protein
MNTTVDIPRRWRGDPLRSEAGNDASSFACGGRSEPNARAAREAMAFGLPDSR